MRSRNTERKTYPNDDYSRFAGPDYHGPEDNFGLGEVDPSREKTLQRIRSSEASEHLQQPGVSGKDRNEGAWFNQSQYQTQKRFIGLGPRGYRRSDARIHEEVCEALKFARDVDASDIEVEVRDGLVTLRGNVPDRNAKVMAERYIDPITGVKDIMNRLNFPQN